MDLNKIGGRKFILALVSIVAAVAVDLLSPKGLSTELVAFFGVIMGAFSVANVVGKGKAIVASAVVEEETTAPPAVIAGSVPVHVENIMEGMHVAGGTLERIEAELVEIKTMQANTGEGVANIQAILLQLMQPQK